jgi:hypothetical protein
VAVRKKGNTLRKHEKRVLRNLLATDVCGATSFCPKSFQLSLEIAKIASRVAKFLMDDRIFTGSLS